MPEEVKYGTLRDILVELSFLVVESLEVSRGERAEDEFTKHQGVVYEKIKALKE